MLNKYRIRRRLKGIDFKRRQQSDEYAEYRKHGEYQATEDMRNNLKSFGLSPRELLRSRLEKMMRQDIPLDHDDVLYLLTIERYL